MDTVPQMEFDEAVARARKAARRGDAVDAGRWLRLAELHLKLLSHYRAAADVEEHYHAQREERRRRLRQQKRPLTIYK
jgi:hypothetical protein